MSTSIFYVIKTKCYYFRTIRNVKHITYYTKFLLVFQAEHKGIEMVAVL